MTPLHRTRTLNAAGSAALVALLVVTAAPADAADEAIVKSPNDRRAYAAFVLPNRMQVVVVSDPETEEGAAALDVNVGSGSDPAERQGLAHFLEHMLFLGTAKYPEPGEYHAFIREHGGSNNAYTSYAHTNYFFDVQAEHLEAALDRFAQFFVAPRFNPPYVSRERQVVHSEFMSKRRSDSRRSHHAFKAGINPNHPYAQFQVGSLETLADRPGSDVREELVRFYERHYSANVMTLVVLGREPVETLEGWVRSRFEAVPDRDARRLSTREPLFVPDSLPMRLDIAPVREYRRVTLRFPIPPVRALYRTKPLTLVAHLIGHEGERSLLSYLKAKGWAEELSAGVGLDHPESATFDISVKLTGAGLAEVDAVIGHVFDYLRLIEDRGVRRWVYDEIARLTEIQFRFEEQAEPMHLVSGLASNLHYYPVRDVLRGGYALEEFDPVAIRRYLSFLRPDNVFVQVTATGLETDSIAPWYETPYRLRPIPEDTFASWSVTTPRASNSLALPEPNPFIPDSLDLVKDAGAPIPERIADRPGFELWHRTDTEFGVPRASFYFTLRSPIANDSPEHAVLTSLLVRAVNDELNEFAYPASLAGLGYSLYKHIRGVSVRIGGWSDKQAFLAQRIADTLRSPTIRDERVEVFKEDLARGLRNAYERAPYRRATSEIRDLLIEPNWSDEQLLAALDGITAEDLRAFATRIFERVRVVALAHGNVTEKEALALGHIVETAFVAPAQPVDAPSGRVVKLEPGAGFVRELDSDHDDSAVALYFQGEDKRERSRALAALLTQVISQPFFDQLRTEQELGYLVFSTLMTMLEAPGLAFVVQSPVADSAQLERHVVRFLADFEKSVDALSVEDFARHRAALLAKMLEEDQQLRDRTGRYWTEIDRRHYEFDTRERLAEAIRAVNLDEFRDYYRALVLDPDRTRTLVVRVPGSAPHGTSGDEPAAGGRVLVRDAAAFKLDRPYFAD